ncbi:hypothetical protein TIFTF001_040648, partial [Ficus carica]
MTVVVNIEPCPKDATRRGPLEGRLSSCINNESFVLPQNASMLEAFYYGNRSGVYTTDFPDNPPLTFDYTNTNFSFDESLIYAPKSTKAKKLKFNATEEIVFQSTAFLAVGSH